MNVQKLKKCLKLADFWKQVQNNAGEEDKHWKNRRETYQQQRKRDLQLKCLRKLN